MFKKISHWNRWPPATGQWNCADLYCFSHCQQGLNISDIPNKYIQIRGTAASIRPSSPNFVVESHILSRLTAGRYWYSVVGRFHFLSCITRGGNIFQGPRPWMCKNDHRLSLLSITCRVCHSFGAPPRTSTHSVHQDWSQNNFTAVTAAGFCLVSELEASNWCLTEPGNISRATTRKQFFILFGVDLLFLVSSGNDRNSDMLSDFD